MAGLFLRMSAKRPSSFGITPVKSFSHNQSCLSNESSPSSVGIGPIRLFCGKYSRTAQGGTRNWDTEMNRVTLKISTRALT